MSFPRYPKYKASGVEWLGDVPAHWEVQRLRQIGRLLKGGGGTKEDVVDAGVPCVRYGDLYTTFSCHITKPRGFVTPETVPDYIKWAEAMGCVGIRVDSPEEVESAIEKANSINDRPVVVEFRVEPTEQVFPMVAAGKGNDEIMLQPSQEKRREFLR